MFNLFRKRQTYSSMEWSGNLVCGFHQALLWDLAFYFCQVYLKSHSINLYFIKLLTKILTKAKFTLFTNLVNLSSVLIFPTKQRPNQITSIYDLSVLLQTNLKWLNFRNSLPLKQSIWLPSYKIKYYSALSSATNHRNHEARTRILKWLFSKKNVIYTVFVLLGRCYFPPRTFFNVVFIC